MVRASLDPYAAFDLDLGLAFDFDLRLGGLAN